MTIRCVTLDLDDTLWDCEPVIQGAEDRFYEWLEQHYPDISSRYEPHELTAHRRDTYERHPHMLHDFTYLRKQWLARLGEEAGYGARLVETGFDVFWKARNAVCLYDKVPGVLQSLHARYQVGAITNGNADVHHIGIGHWFHFVVTAADAGSLKPAPDIFHHALSRAEVDPQHAVHVGDHPVNDVRGAAAVGMRTVWVNATGGSWPDELPPPDAEISSVEQLDEALTTIHVSAE